jgi:hypothetical protein
MNTDDFESTRGLLTTNENMYFAVAKDKKIKMIHTGRASFDSWLIALLVPFL